MSDLHLEVCQQYSTFTFPAVAPFILLAGDIGRLIDYDTYHAFLEAQIARYKRVFLILGNHEFYGLNYASGLDMARCLVEKASSPDKLVLLHRTQWDDPDSELTILECKLWSHIPEESRKVVQYKVNHFRQIGGWTAQDHSKAHKEDLAWLREQVAQLQRNTTKPKRRLLVATHHSPIVEGSTRPEYLENPWSAAFSTELLNPGRRKKMDGAPGKDINQGLGEESKDETALDGQEKKKPGMGENDNGKALEAGRNVQDDPNWKGVKARVFGHTHWSTRLSRNGIKLVANQRGYFYPGGRGRKHSKEKDGMEFDDSLTITA